jgi:hypothetical protein
MSAAAAVWIALVLTLVLAALHLAAPRIRRLPFVPESATGSFAGGLAVAYVFLHLLPELVEGKETIGAALHRVVQPTPLLDLAIFLVALAGFVAFFGLERLADRTGAGRSATPGPAPSPVQQRVYRLHLGSFVIYNALITYTMPLRVRTGLAFAILFAVAMGLHFVLTDRGLEERYHEQFGRRGRLLLAGALVVGWLLAAVATPTSAVVVSLLTALLAGSILLNVFKEEIPSGRQASFPWFLTGLVVYAGLLTAVTALDQA